MNRRILSATMVALLVFLTCVPAFANTRSSVMKVNASGETYGTLSQQGEMLDLIAAVANNGKEGYIKKTDVEANSPTCPADAVRKMEKMERAGDRTIPVYKADGITIIGDFTIENTRITSIEIVEPAVSVASTTTSANLIRLTLIWVAVVLQSPQKLLSMVFMLWNRVLSLGMISISQ